MGRATGCERVHTLSRSPGAVLAGIWVFDGAGAGIPAKNLVSGEAGVGRSAPLHPLGRRGARGLRPSRALPGLCWRGFGFSTELVRRSGEGFGFRRKGRGALRSPTSPRGTGSERARPSRALPGLFWRGFGFLTVRAFRRRIWFPAKRAWGAPLPYIPSGDGVREGATLSRSPVGLFW